jgi:hypothetical protein
MNRLIFRRSVNFKGTIRGSVVNLKFKIEINDAFLANEIISFDYITHFELKIW